MTTTDTLILAEPTLELLRHFEPISADGTGSYAGGIVITPGDMIRVANKWKRLLARAKAPQQFERPFAIYNMRRWLGGALAPFKTPKLTFAAGHMIVTEADTEAGLSIRYPTCRPDAITTFDRDPDLEPAFVFSLARDQLKQFLEIASNLALPNLLLVGAKGDLVLGAADAAKPEDGKMGARLVIGKVDRKFTLSFLVNDFKKLLHGDYKVAVTFGADTDREGAAHLVSADGNRHYWILSQSPPSGMTKARSDKEEI
jgi:hypothetical protein